MGTCPSKRVPKVTGMLLDYLGVRTTKLPVDKTFLRVLFDSTFRNSLVVECLQVLGDTSKDDGQNDAENRGEDDGEEEFSIPEPACDGVFDDEDGFCWVEAQDDEAEDETTV